MSKESKLPLFPASQPQTLHRETDADEPFSPVPSLHSATSMHHYSTASDEESGKTGLPVLIAHRSSTSARLQTSPTSERLEMTLQKMQNENKRETDLNVQARKEMGEMREQMKEVTNLVRLMQQMMSNQLPGSADVSKTHTKSTKTVKFDDKDDEEEDSEEEIYLERESELPPVDRLGSAWSREDPRIPTRKEQPETSPSLFDEDAPLAQRVEDAKRKVRRVLPPHGLHFGNPPLVPKPQWPLRDAAYKWHTLAMDILRLYTAFVQDGTK